MSARTKAAFVASCLAFADSEQHSARQDLERARARVDELSRALLDAVRQAHGARRRAGAAEPAGAERARLEREFEQILATPGVRDVEVNGEVIRVLTDPLVLEHDGRRFLIGEFALVIDLGTGISIDNLDNTITHGGWEHPHVQGRSPCLGNVRVGALKLLGEFELAALTSILMQFLETYDAATAYCPIDRWREVGP